MKPVNKIHLILNEIHRTVSIEMGDLWSWVLRNYV